MKISALASGSNGNSTLIVSDKAKILIDIGISLKELIKRLDCLNIDADSIDAVFVSHEHIDHIRSVGALNRKFNIPIHINKSTFEGAQHLLGKVDNVNFIDSDSTKIKDLDIQSIRKFHDAADPISFVVSDGTNKAGVITDLGIACDNVKEAVKDVDCLVLEFNYDVTMLRNGPYPPHLKKRIESKLGHLSNEDAALLLLDNASSRLKTVFLAHLSENNNDPELAYKTIKSVISHRSDLADINIHVTDRDEHTELLSVNVN